MNERKTLEQIISAFDSLFSGKVEKETAEGRIFQAKTQNELFQSYNPDCERLATLREIAQMRVLPFDIFGERGTSPAKELIRLAERDKLTKDKIKCIAEDYPDSIAYFASAYREWKFRLTSSTR